MRAPVKWLHRWCAGVHKENYRDLASSDKPFVCPTCSLSEHVTGDSGIPQGGGQTVEGGEACHTTAVFCKEL